MNSQLFKFRLSLRGGTVREGFLLKLTDEEGKEAWGEAVPSVRRSRETLGQVEAQLRNYTEIPKDKLHPSVAFCVESAHLQLAEPLQPPFYPLRTARLLQGDVSAMAQAADALEKEGTELVKVKVGPLNFEEAKGLLNHLKSRFQLRVEFNRMWEMKQAAKLLEETALDLDFAEEPGKAGEDLSSFPFPFALDEALQEDNIPHAKNLKTLVFKPTLLGGESRLLALAKKAQERGLQLILSSAFEGPIGLFQVASLFFRLPQPTLAHGLGTAAYWKKATTSCTLSGNFLHFNEMAAHDAYDELIEIT